MEKVGIFYGSTGGSTKQAAEAIAKALGKGSELHDIEEATPEMIASYPNLVIGTSAWGIGDMQDDWERFVDELAEIDFAGKKVALFGVGDQAEYPESFVDGMGTLYCRLPDKNCVVGFWPTEGYKFYFSLAEKDGQFVGLPLDPHNEDALTADRIKQWTTQLKKEFN